MALETLKDVKEINGHPLVELDKLSGDGPTPFISISHKRNEITFKIQNGPIKENGHNGCQVDEIISTALLMIKGLQKKFPCQENVKCMTALYEAYSYLQLRKLDREIRKVEGENKL